MANKAKGFVVVAGQRPSGSAFWMVRGTLDRHQIRREFDNRPDALAFAELKNSELFGTKPKQAHLLTHLTPEQLHAAEAVALQLKRDFPEVSILDLLDYYRDLSQTLSVVDAARISPAIGRLKKKYPDVDLGFACDWFASNYQPPKSTLSLRIALEHYLADTQRRHSKHTLSTPQYNRIGYAMTELEEHFGSDEPIAHLTSERLHDFLKQTTKGRDGEAFSNKTWNNRRGYLTAFFEFCRQEHWLDMNPASGIRSYTKRQLGSTPPAVMTTERAEQLMDFLESFKEGRLVPFYALCLFAGIRPDWDNGEISKLRPEHFNLTTGELKLPAEITKTRRPRMVRLQPNLVNWLKRYPLEKHPIICTNFKKLHIQVRKQFGLEHDVLRHTYCTMLVGKFRSVADAALQAGNSEGVLWGNYLNLVPKEQAIEFWKIGPKRAARH